MSTLLSGPLVVPSAIAIPTDLRRLGLEGLSFLSSWTVHRCQEASMPLRVQHLPSPPF